MSNLPNSSNVSFSPRRCGAYTSRVGAGQKELGKRCLARGTLDKNNSWHSAISSGASSHPHKLLAQALGCFRQLAIKFFPARVYERHALQDPMAEKRAVISSTAKPHSLARARRTQIFFKTGSRVPKSKKNEPEPRGCATPRLSRRSRCKVLESIFKAHVHPP